MKNGDFPLQTVSSPEGNGNSHGHIDGMISV